MAGKNKTDDMIGVATIAALKAGEIITSKMSTRKVDFKGRIDLVTDADKDAEQAIIDVIHSNYPGHSILTEESGEIDKKGEYTWIIDPLDGTNNFANGFPVFCVSIGIQHKGTIIIGIVHDPVKGETFRAHHGKGAFLNNTKIRVSTKKKVEDSIIATGFPYDRQKYKKPIIDTFSNVYDVARGIRRCGAAALDMCNVACGRLDGYYEHAIKAWDIAAGLIIVREAGGKVTDFDGKSWQPGSESVVCSNKKIHKELLGMIR